MKRAEAEAKSEFEQAEAVVSDGQVRSLCSWGKRGENLNLICFSCLVHEQKEVDQLLTQQTTIKLQTQRYAQKIDAARAECAKLQQEENRQQILVDVSVHLAPDPHIVIVSLQRWTLAGGYLYGY